MVTKRADGRVLEASGARDAEGHFEILRDITGAMRSAMEPQEVLEYTLDASIRATGATSGSILLIRGDEILEIVAARGLGAGVEEKVRPALGQGITGWVAERGTSLNVPDVRRDPRYIRVRSHVRSQLAVPMLRQGRPIGVIAVGSTRLAAFSEQDERLLSIIAAQAAQVLENARILSSLRSRAKRNQVLVEIAEVLTSSAALPQVFEGVMAVLARRLSIGRGVIALLEAEAEELAIEVAYGLTQEEIRRGRYRIGEGIIGRAMETGEPIGIPDVSREPAFLRRTGALGMGREGERVSFFAIPIGIDGRTVGVLGVDRPFASEESFRQDLQTLRVVGGMIAQTVRVHLSHSRERRRLLEENRLLRRQLGSRYTMENVIGSSPGIRRVAEIVDLVRSSQATVLLRGESGTGKDLIAQAIHFGSLRREGPFVKVNCAAIPDALLEAELFGYRKGAFTGALADRPGKFAAADGGTIFLDEIAEMSPALQAKLLRVLQDRAIDPIGSDEPVPVDVRIIAATNRDLEAAVAAHSFREDLYFRLNVLSIELPPLRDRREDIPALAEHFLHIYAERDGRGPLRLSREALRALLEHDWPGNVRELENAIERAVVLSRGPVVRPEDLGLLKAAPDGAGAPATADDLKRSVEAYAARSLAAGIPAIWDRTIRAVESTLVEAALRQARGVRRRAATLLGIHRNTLRKKLRDLGPIG